MKRNRKTIATILCIIMLFLCASPSFAFNKSESNYDILLNKGYPAEYLSSLSDSFLEKMVEQIGDNCVAEAEVQKTTLTESSSITRATINEEHLDLQIVASPIYNQNTNRIVTVLVAVSWEWALFRPLYCAKDAIAVNWENLKFDLGQDSFYAEDFYKSNANDDWSVARKYTKFAISNQGGAGHWTDLEEFEPYVGGAMLFLLDPEDPMYLGSTKSTVINVEYAHSPVPLSGISLDYMGVGIGINWNLPCDTLADSDTVKYSV